MVHYLELGDYCRIAGEVLNLDPEQIAEFPNKRCAFLALERFLAANGRPILEADPNTDVPMMMLIAGDASQDSIIAWIEHRSMAVD